jgi:integrase
MRWQDLDLVEGKRLRVVQTLVAPRYQLRIEQPKTDAGRRSVALDEVTVAALREHRRRQTEERLAFGPGWGTQPLADDLCFTEPDGGPVKPALFLLRFQQASKNAGLRKVRLHDLRHGHITALMEAGVPLPVIAQRVGHSSVAVTGDIYSHVRQELRDDTAELGAALLFGPPAATDARS